MERFKVLAKTGRIALLQVRFDSELELQRFCENLPRVGHTDSHTRVSELTADETGSPRHAPHQGAALAACLITPDFQEAV